MSPKTLGATTTPTGRWIKAFTARRGSSELHYKTAELAHALNDLVPQVSERNGTVAVLLDSDHEGYDHVMVETYSLEQVELLDAAIAALILARDELKAMGVDR